MLAFMCAAWWIGGCDWRTVYCADVCHSAMLSWLLLLITHWFVLVIVSVVFATTTPTSSPLEMTNLPTKLLVSTNVLFCRILHANSGRVLLKIPMPYVPWRDPQYAVNHIFIRNARRTASTTSIIQSW
jgi:hypothetical protein